MLLSTCSIQYSQSCEVCGCFGFRIGGADNILDSNFMLSTMLYMFRWRLSWFFVQMQGHSVTRRLNSDGKVDTNQTLHNLNEGLFPPSLLQLGCFSICY